MRFRCALAILILAAAEAFGQTVTTLNLSTQGHNPDFSTFPFTRPVAVGSALPATCQTGQLFFNTAAGPGQNMYACTQANVWTVMGGSTLLPAGPSTLGGVVVPSNSVLSVDSNGVLSVNIGTGPSTVAAGNDTRIVNALQPTSQIPAGNVLGLAPSATIDTTNASNISTGTLNLSLFPAKISSNTSGNAATATAFATTPQACSTGLFAQGISATGAANCAQVAYSQLSGAPSLYNQILQAGGRALTQRANLNFVAGSNITLTPTDNGLNTTTLTISSAGLQPPTTNNSIVKYSSGSSTTAAQSSDIIAALGFTPQNASALNSSNGYAGLDTNGLLLVNEMPPTINSNTNGRAATAAALSATPTGCVGNQFAQGIAANGNAICATPTSTSGLPDPGANGLVKRTAANTDTAATPGSDYYAPGTQIQPADLPGTIASSTTGNAATATALANTPSGCPGGQFATGITANGQALCGTPASPAGGVRTGTGLPTSSTCTSSALGNLYIQTGSFQRFFGCQYNGSSYTWWPMNPSQINVMGFGCKADDLTDDSGCFNTAIQTAQILNTYSGAIQGAEVYVPNGRYKISNPIVLPRTGVFASGSGGNVTAAVSLVGEHMTSTVLDGESITTGDVIMWQPCTLAGTPPACTSTTGRTQGERIANFTILPPNSLGPNGTGLGGIHYAYTRHSTGETGCYNGVTNAIATICTDEKARNMTFENLFFYGSNQYNPYEIYMEGDCNFCSFRNVWGDPSIGSGSVPFNTVLIRTDVCFAAELAQDACGLNYSMIENSGLGIERGGYGGTFQGSFNQSVMRATWSNGLWGGIANDPNAGVGGSYAYQFVNSFGSVLQDLVNEGGAGVQIQLTNSKLMHFINAQLGSPIITSTPGASPMGDGIHLTNSSENTFEGYGHATPFNSWSSKNAGIYMINIDANSHNNVFLKMEASSASDINVADLSTNFVQWCDESENTPTAKCGSPGLPQSGTPAGTPGTTAPGLWGTIGYGSGYLGNGGTAAVSAGPGAGSSPSLSLGAGSGNLRGTISLTTGSSPSANSVVATVTFANGFPSAPVCEVFPNGPSTAVLSGSALVYGANEAAGSSSAPASFQLMVGSTPLSPSTTYNWKYDCLR
ncbi:MAG: hypothetical protein JOY62_19460 [Acidobacteriaceae bacterium]|nr:hypothetical protein [Acidobacteriaceae bacterium]MBV9782145.1 hypothetical protein [Acidobacteriaceae bacterium]